MQKIRKLVLAALLGSLLLQPVFAQSALTPEQLTIRVERMSESTQRTEAAMAAVQQQMKDLSADMARMGRLIDNRAVLEMIQQVDGLADEISQLNGAIEEQGHAIEDVKKRQRELYLDIDRRLRDLESGASAQASSQPINIPQIPSAPAVAPSSSSSSQQAASVEPAAPAASQSSTASITPRPSVTQSEEKAAYQAAFDTLKEGRYKKAKTELTSFLGKFPNSSYAGNAQYWLGEAHYVTRNFDQGIVEFNKVLNNYPGSNKVPDAMLKLGYTFYELKQFEQSRAILQDLRKRFPDDAASRLASKRLDRIRKEGH